MSLLRWAAFQQHPILRAVQPNPSIEGTSNSKLRLPLAAPHVKR